MSKLDDALAATSAVVNKAVTVMESARLLVDQMPTLIQAAKDSALAAGATDAQLQSFTDLQTLLSNEADHLSADVVANTPAAGPPSS